MPDLTPDEIAFFATGELQGDLAAQHQVVEPEPVAAPAVEPVVAPIVNTPAASDQTDFLRQSLLAEQQRAAQAQAELALLKQQFEARTNPPVAAPDPASDPLGAMLHQQQQLAAEMASLQNRLQTEQNNNQMRTQFQQFAQSVQAIKQAFEKTTPDFNDAYQYVRNTRAADLRISGVPENRINEVLMQDELNLSQNALAIGKNPAEEVYNMAKRYGYVPKATTPNGQAKVEAILNGQAADKNPGKGAPPAADITVESLKDMSSNDLNKVVMNDAQWAKLVGGKSHDIF